MKVLILSCNTGEGHNSAARALMDELDRRDIKSEMVDPLSFISESTSKFISACYNNMIKKTPLAFGVMYKGAEKFSDTELTSPVYWVTIGCAGKLLNYIRDNHFDAVISTHLFGMTALTAIRKRLDDSIPSYGVFTDYTVYPFIGETSIDAYFYPQVALEADMLAHGLSRETIVPTGIPVRAAFNHRIDKAAAREQLGLPQDKKILLVMTGGVGCENMIALCDEVVAATDDRVVAAVMVGRNEEMKTKLTERYGEDGRIRPVPFTTLVNVYMNAADVLITKAGGLSTTEAAVANVPIVHVKSIPGCETYNVQFFSEHGLSLSAKTDGEAAAMAMRLAFDEEGAARMCEAQRALINPHAARDIINVVESGAVAHGE